jgi:hypothetical protein
VTSPLDAIRAKVEEVRTRHRFMGTLKYGQPSCGDCGRILPCGDLKWAEAALKLAERLQAFEDAWRGLTMFDLDRAGKHAQIALADIAEGLKNG